MKTIVSLRSKFLSSLFVLIAFVGFTSCDKNDDNTNNSGNYIVTGNASGSQVVPSITGSAVGTFNGTYNANTNLLTYNMAWTSLSGSATTTALYTGSAGTNGTLIRETTITTSGSTGASVGTITLTDSQETALLNGSMYYLIGTSAHASGEVRGQLTATVQ